MRLPRDISGVELYMKVHSTDCNHRLSKFVVADENDHAPAMPVIQILRKFGYHSVRQTGSHVRLVRIYDEQEHHITIPLHKNLRIGTLHAILQDVSARLGVEKEDIFKKR